MVDHEDHELGQYAGTVADDQTRPAATWRGRVRPHHRHRSSNPAELGDPAHTSVSAVLPRSARRRSQLIVSDRGYFVFLALLPFIAGCAVHVGTGRRGLPGFPAPMGDTCKPSQILVLLNVSAVFMGTALTIRDLIGERAIFRREQAVGLSTTAY